MTSIKQLSRPSVVKPCVRVMVVVERGGGAGLWSGGSYSAVSLSCNNIEGRYLAGSESGKQTDRRANRPDRARPIAGHHPDDIPRPFHPQPPGLEEKGVLRDCGGT